MSSVPCLLLVGIVPLIVRLNIVEFNSTQGMVHSLWPQCLDLFYSWKSNFILGIGLLSLLLMPWRRLVTLPFSLLTLIPAAMACILISALLSDFPRIAFFGGPQSFQGAWVQIALLVLFLYSACVMQEQKHQSLLFWVAGFCLVTVTIFATLEFFGIAPFLSEPFRSLIFVSNLPFRQGFETKAASTLGSSNQLGAYAAILAPFFFSFSQTTKIQRSFAFLFSVLCLWLLVSSGSKTGAIACFVGMFSLFRFKKTFATGVVLAAFLFPLAGISQTNELKHLATKNGRLVLVTTRYSLVVSSKNQKIFFHSLEGKEIKHHLETPEGNAKQIVFDDPQMQDILLRVILDSEDGPYVEIIFKGQRLPLALSDGVKILAWHKGWESEPAAVFPLPLSDRALTNRGYLWKRTIPLLKEALLWGHGPDTFANYFPQRDFFGKMRADIPWPVIADNPHSWYLSTIFSTGFVSLICFLGIFYLFLKVNTNHPFTRGVQGSLMAFCVLGLSYDLSNGVAAVFWPILGAGFSALPLRSPLS